MIRFTPGRLGLAAIALLGASLFGHAQIERLNLQQMVTRADNAVVGEIVGKQVIRIDHPLDGPELYFTKLTIQGRSLVNGVHDDYVVTFAGGFIDEENGVWNSEAPSEADTRLGNQIVAFYAFTENMGGDLSANALYAAHGGLYRTVSGRKGTVVLGRGEGYAVESNVKLSKLDTQITSIDKSQK